MIEPAAGFTLPLTIYRSFVVLLKSNLLVSPAARFRLLLKVRVPTVPAPPGVIWLPVLSEKLPVTVPLPFRVCAAPKLQLEAETSNVPAGGTVMVAEPLMAPLLPKASVPWPIVVVPVYVLTPFNVHLPVLVLTMEIMLAPPSAMAPVTLLLTLVPSSCRVLLVAAAVTLPSARLAEEGFRIVVPPLPPLSVIALAVICGLPLATFGPLVMFSCRGVAPEPIRKVPSV